MTLTCPSRWITKSGRWSRWHWAALLASISICTIRIDRIALLIVTSWLFSGIIVICYFAVIIRAVHIRFCFRNSFIVRFSTTPCCAIAMAAIVSRQLPICTVPIRDRCLIIFLTFLFLLFTFLLSLFEDIENTAPIFGTKCRLLILYVCGDIFRNDDQ